VEEDDGFARDRSDASSHRDRGIVRRGSNLGDADPPPGDGDHVGEGTARVGTDEDRRDRRQLSPPDPADALFAPDFFGLLSDFVVGVALLSVPPLDDSLALGSPPFFEDPERA